MSESTTESGWISAAEFHRAPGVSNWRVTGGGPQAVFTATSLAQAAGLLAPIVVAAERWGILPDVDVRPEAVAVRDPSRGWDGIPAAATEFAADVRPCLLDRQLRLSRGIRFRGLEARLA